MSCGGEAFVPGEGCVAVGGFGVGVLPGGVEGGEFFDEFPVLCPAWGDDPVVERIVVGEPVDPGFEVFEEEAGVLGEVR